MRFAAPALPAAARAGRSARALRLAYCLNLHPADDLAGFRAGLERVTSALRARLAPERPFGVGLYLSARVAHELDLDRGARERVAAELRERGFDAFTWNAFPFGGFHRAGLKAGVFEPSWLEPERLAFTEAVARLAVLFAGEPEPGRHLSISTHPGGFGARVAGARERDLCAENMLRAVAALAKLERASGWRIVLALEAEPRASAGDNRELAQFHERARALARSVLGPALGLSSADEAEALARRHLGTCLDTCHAAVEFEEPAAALERATAGATALGKLQFTSALCFAEPGRDAELRARFLALDEPVYLHQTNGRRGAEILRADDLGDLARALAEPRSAWLDCSEWRCHFHVPVDLAELARPGEAPRGASLGTTRSEADQVLDLALGDPARWGTDELHVELETYTWSLLPEAARGAGELVDGLAREYAHVLARLAAAGFQSA